MSWKYLAEKPGSVSKQLFIAGTRIMASSVWASKRSNGLSIEEIASEFGIEIEAAKEAVEYSELNLTLIRSESGVARDKLRTVRGTTNR